MRRLKGAATAVLRVLGVAAAIALILLVLEVLVGVLLVGIDALFRCAEGPSYPRRERISRYAANARSDTPITSRGFAAKAS